MKQHLLHVKRNRRMSFFGLRPLLFCLALLLPAVAWGQVTEHDISQESLTITTDGEYRITQNDNTNATTNNITVNADVTATVTLDGVNIDMSTEQPGACAFKLESGANVTLILAEGTTNVLKSANLCAGLQAPEGTTLTIQGPGSLVATGGSGDLGSSGIGGGAQNVGGTITITGGTVTATGGYLAAGIGGSGDLNLFQTRTSPILITGGTVTAKGGSDAAGIGGGPLMRCGPILITGGTVTAQGGRGFVGIGGGSSLGDGDMPTETLIIGPEATLTDGTEPTTNYTGFVFNNSAEAKVKGNLTLPINMTIPKGKILTIPNKSTLTIGNGVTLTNNGKIRIAKGGTFTPPEGMTGIQYELTEDMVTLVSSEGLTYTGTPITPQVTFSEGYTKDTDYTVTYSDNTNVGTATVTVAPTPDGGLFGKPVTNLFTILKATATDPETPAPAAVTYGTKLADIPLDDGWQWEEAEIVPTVTNSGYSAYYEVTDYTNYDWSSIPDYDESTHRVTRTVSLTVNKATATIADITVTDKTYDETAIVVEAPAVTGAGLTDVKATLAYKPANAEEDTYTKDAPVNAGSYIVKASYAGDENHEATDKTALFTISKATPSYTSPADLVATYGQTLEDVELPSGWNWEDVAVTPVGNAGTNDFKATFTPDDTDNYNTVEGVEVSITVTPKEITEDMVSLSATEFTESGEVQKPTVVVADLADGTDYTVVYSDEKSSTVGDYTVTVTGQGNYNGTVIKTYAIKAKPVDPTDPDPDPTPDPDPDPVYYTVILPAVEGVTTDPSAGDYEVEVGGSFSFRLTLDEEYNESVLVVTTSRGETLTSGAGDGKYVIRNVYSDLMVYIDGIEKNPDPVANEAIEADIVKVWGGSGCLHLRLGTTQPVSVYTFTGSLLRRDEVAVGDTRWSLPVGNYIVLVGDKIYKVAIR